MDLILWRHADAEVLQADQEDATRRLTPKGIKQAHKMAYWLDSHLPETCRILVSPTVRTKQTAQAISALGRKYKLLAELSPEANIEALITAINWPNNREPVLLVGHQPNLGALATHVITPSQTECVIRKGNVWWISQKGKDDEGLRTYLKAIVPPDLIIK